MNFKLLIFAGIFISFSISAIGQTAIEDLYQSKLEQQIFEKAGTQFTLYNYEVEDIMSPIYGLELYYIKIPKELIEMQVKIVEKNDTIEVTYSKYTDANTIVLLSGGFHRYEANEIDKNHHGLVATNSEIISEKIPWKTGGVIYQFDNDIIIDHISEYNEPLPLEAIQSKPVLVKNSKNDIYSDDREHHNRIGIGFTTQDELLICLAFNRKGRGISSYEFAEILIQNKLPTHPNAKHILAMDGGPASHMYIPQINKHLGVNSIMYIPNLVEIKFK